MRRGLWAAAVAALAAALWPEIPRYRAERSLRIASTSLMRVLTTPLSPTDVSTFLEASAQAAQAAAPGLPDDPRPWIIGGSARLVAGRLEEALAAYREGLRRGERAEIDLNIGRVHEAGGETEAALTGYVRAGWISPPMLNALSGEIRAKTEAELIRLQAALRAGELPQAPPPPR